MEPLESVRSQRKQVGLFRNCGKTVSAKDLSQHGFTMPGQIQLSTLSKARKIGHHKNLLALELADKSKNFSVSGEEDFHFPAPESGMLLALGNHALHPPEQGV